MGCLGTSLGANYYKCRYPFNNKGKREGMLIFYKKIGEGYYRVVSLDERKSDPDWSTKELDALDD
jgi:hypothetical protein